MPRRSSSLSSTSRPMSIMSGKALPCGEGGFLITNDKYIYEKAVAFGHYGRTGQSLTFPDLQEFSGLPQGGQKYRMHQLSAAVGRVQLKHYGARLVEIQKSMNYFWDLLDGLPGVKAHRPSDPESTMGGWYAAHGLYRADELDGLDIQAFCKAVAAEGCGISAGCNFPLHLHPLLNDADIYGHGKPTRIANTDRDVREGPGSLPVTESVPTSCYSIPWFKHYRPQVIEEHAQAIRKVVEHAGELQ